MILLPYMCQQQICPSNATYANKSMCRYETIMLVYLPHMSSLKATLSYIDVPMNMYACHIRYVCPTTLVICSTQRPHMTAHLCKTKQ